MINRKYFLVFLFCLFSLQLIFAPAAKASNSYYFFWLGEQAKNDHQYELADSLFHLAQIRDPKSEKILIERLSVLYFQKKYNKIIQIGEKGIETGFKNSDIFLMVADSYQQLGDDHLAIKVLKRCLRISERVDKKIYFQFYQLYQKMGEDELAFHYLKKSEKYSENNPDFLYKIAKVYAQLGKNDQFITTLKKILNINPDHYKANIWLGDYYYGNRDFQNAANYLKHIYDISGTLPPIPLRELFVSLFYNVNYQKIIALSKNFQIKKLDFLIQKVIFDAYFHSGNYGKTVEFGSQYILSHPEADEKTRNRAYEEMAIAEYRMRNFNKSFEYFRKITDEFLLLANLQTITAISQQTHDTRLFEKLYTFTKTKNDTLQNIIKTVYAYYYAKNDSLEKSGQMLNEIDTTICRDGVLLNSLAYIYFKSENDTVTAKALLERREDARESTSMTLGNFCFQDKEFEKSIPFFIEALQEDSTLVEPYYRLAAAYKKLNRKKEEFEIFEKALKKFPDNPDLLNLIGYTYAEDGINLEEAIQLLQKAVSIDSENVYIWDSLAWAFYQSEQYSKALDAMQIVIDSNLQDSVINYHIGNIFWKLGQIEKARSNWETSLEIDNDEDGVTKSKKMLEKLKQINDH